MSSALGKLVVVVVGIIVGAVGFLYWQKQSETSFVPLIAGFEEKNELMVFAAHLVTVVNNTDEGLIDLLDADQTAIIPATVNYTVDLSKLNERDISWDKETGRMTITAPPVRVQPPNLLEQDARYYRQGVWTPRTTEKLARLNSVKAGNQATELAKSPVYLGMARNAAKTALANTAEAYLLGLGFRNTEVTVRFKNAS